jgi:hypothetical protein
MKNNKNNLNAMIFGLVISAFMYKIFFALSPYIWSKNLIVDPMVIAPELRRWYAMERDGWEGPTLYVMSLLVLTTSVIYSSFGISKVINLFSNCVTKFLVTKIELLEGIENIQKNKLQLFSILRLLFITLIFIFVYKIGYKLPLRLVAEGTMKYSVILFMIIALVSKLHTINKNYFLILLCIVLIPICFLSTSPTIDQMNYHYVYFPALKILKGYSLDNIYIQYDLLLSLFVLPIIYFKKNPAYLEIIAQASTYIYFTSIFLVSQKLLKCKNLIVPFILSIVLLRIYGSYYDSTQAIQITPLRLDWWLVPFFLSFRYRLSHWSVGLSLGVLALLHKNFGFIYTLAYIQVVLLIFLEEYVSTIYSKKKSFKKQFLELIDIAIPFIKPIMLIVLFYIATYITYGGVGLNDTAKIYQQIGFGFDRITQVSFYWYIPAIMSFVIITLIQLKNKISRNYFTSVFFLATIAIGNSLYFLGRSHESNLTWISGSILLLFFIGFDLAILQFSNSGELSKKSIFTKKHYFSFYHALSWVFLISIIYTFETNFIKRSKYQLGRVQKGTMFTPAPSLSDIKDYKKFDVWLKVVTRSSQKVFFMIPRTDFLGYYWGDYDPIAYFSPYEAWVYSKNLEFFLQNLLDTNYYIVTNEHTLRTTLDTLKYNSVIKNSVSNVGHFTILYNDPNKETNKDTKIENR